MSKEAGRKARRSKSLLEITSLIALGFAYAGQAQAQTTTQTPAQPQAGGAAAKDTTASVSDIIVTGSRIRGVAPTGSNVISVGTAELKLTSAVTTQDLINQIPQNIGTGFNEGTFTSPFGGINSTRGGAVNLRGVGPQATLLLLDGHRLVPNGTSGTFIDPSSVPASAIQRIEVVADGASAIYGADAVAGVVNVILRRDLNGVEINARGGLADGMKQWSGSVVAGHRWSTGQVMLSYEHSWREALAGRDRGFFTSDNRANGGSDYRQSQCNPGTVRIGTTNYPVRAGTVTPASLVVGDANRCDLTPLGDILPSQKRDVVAGTFSQQLLDWLRFTSQGLFMHRSFESRFIAQGGTREQTTLTLPSTNPFFVAPAGTAPASEFVEYSFAPEYGPLLNNGTERTYEIVAGFDVSLPSNWRVYIGGVYGYNHARALNPALNQPLLTAALNSTSAATAFNPFGTNSRALIDSFFTGIFEPDGLNRLREGELRADGSLFELPAGKVRMALGAEYTKTTFYGGTRRGTVTVPTFAPTSIRREVKSAYAELYVPVLGDGGRGPGSLSISGAVRYDDYSDVGKTTNPKLGLTYRPISGIELRASYGTSFRAPTLNDTITVKPGALISGITRPDPLAGNAQVPVVLLIAGNPNLKPETATTWSLGATFAPDALPGFRAVFNYFNLDYSRQIASVQNDLTVLQRAATFQSVIRTFTPPLTTAQILADPVVASLIALGIPTQTLPATTRYIIDARPYNLGATKTDGIDFDLSYVQHMAAGSLTGRVTGAYFFKYKVQQTDTAPITNEINHYLYPLRLKARTTLSWDGRGYNVSAYVNYANQYSNPSSTLHPKIKSYTTVDLHGSVDLPFANLTLALDVNNLFDRDPPFVDVDGAYDPTEANPIGRYVSLSLRARF